MRQFKHLSSETKRSIYAGYLTGMPKLTIAKQLQIDNSTVHYHIKKIQHLNATEIVALIIPPCLGCEAGHTAFKCIKCGKAFDNIKTEEFQELRALREKVRTLETKLSNYAKRATAAAHDHNPVSAVFC